MSSRAVAIGVASVVILVVGAVVLTVALSSSRNRLENTAGAGSSAPADVTSGQPDFPSSTPTDQPTSDPVSVSLAATPSARSLPATETAMNLRRVATSPHLEAVAMLLDTYFSGVNDHDAERATSVFAPDGAIDPSDPDQVGRFAEGISTTTDSRIQVLSITSGRTKDGPGIIVRVHFRSNQAAAYGPHNETCTDWALNYPMISDGNGGLLLLGSKDVVNRSC